MSEHSSWTTGMSRADVEELMVLGMAHHIECGRHSGVPDCCIIFWVRCFIWMNWDQCAAYSAWWKALRPRTRFGRQPCPNCVIEGRYAGLVLKKCDCRKKKGWAGLVMWEEGTGAWRIRRDQEVFKDIHKKEPQNGV